MRQRKPVSRLPTWGFFVRQSPISVRKRWPAKKIKREKEEELTLHLQATQDIAASLGKIKEDNQLLVGFALETNNEQQNAEGKLERKNFDFIVLNSLNDAGAGFRHDTNKISIIDRKGREDYPLKPKQEVAQDIIDHLVSVLTH